MGLNSAFKGLIAETCTRILIIKPTRCTNFSNLFLEQNSTCFRQFLCPSSGVFHCTHSNGVCHTGLLRACEQAVSNPVLTYTTAVCTVKNSWWWTEELSETCRVLFQNKFEKLVHIVGFILRMLEVIGDKCMYLTCYMHLVGIKKKLTARMHGAESFKMLLVVSWRTLRWVFVF